MCLFNVFNIDNHNQKYDKAIQAKAAVPGFGTCGLLRCEGRMKEPTLSEIMGEKRKRAERQRIKTIKLNIEAYGLLHKTKKSEQVSEVKRKREKSLRLSRDISNLRVDPVDGRAPNGDIIRVNRNTGPGHFLALHRQRPDVWTKPMVDAAASFARDYEVSEFGGIGAGSLEPRVDSSLIVNEGKMANSMLARRRLLALRERIGGDDFVILELAAGIGLTQTEMHTQGMGDKRALGERLRLALNRAAAFYGGAQSLPKSQFLVAAQSLVESFKGG